MKRRWLGEQWDVTKERTSSLKGVQCRKGQGFHGGGLKDECVFPRWLRWARERGEGRKKGIP